MVVALTALLAGAPALVAQDTTVADSAVVGATGHGRLQLEARHDDGEAGGGAVRLTLDARIAARVGLAASATVIAIVLGAGGLVSRRARRRDVSHP